MELMKKLIKDSELNKGVKVAQVDTETGEVLGKGIITKADKEKITIKWQKYQGKKEFTFDYPRDSVNTKSLSGIIRMK